MQAFNPAAPARSVIDAGLVRADLHHSLYANLAGRADLESGSQQLIVGGIGSGKTTELLLAAKWLQEQGNARPFYIDVTADTDLSGLNSGALLASFGIHLTRQLSRDSKIGEGQMAVATDVREFAYGKTKRIWVSLEDQDGPDPDDDYSEDPAGYFAFHQVPGKLKPPLPVLQRDISEIYKPLAQLVDIGRDAYGEIVIILDGLDRLLQPEKFLSVAHQDFRLFRQLNVSVIATAPISILYGVGRDISEQFDRIQHIPALLSDPEDDFLFSVLEKRGALKLMSSDEANTLCASSGGVLRDLISLARDGAEESYISGHDLITSDDVLKVVRQLGSSYLRGLGQGALDVVLALQKTKVFDPQKPANVELLVTRRVLEYSSTDFRPHPALLAVVQRKEHLNG
jgi:hypothetical protein